MESFITKLAWVTAIVGTIATLINLGYFIYLYGTDDGERTLALYRMAKKPIKTRTLQWLAITGVAVLWICR